MGRRDGRPGGRTLARVREHPDGVRLDELDGGRIGEAVTTPSGTVELFHSHLAADVPRLIHPVDAARVGVGTGDLAEVATSEAAIAVLVDVSDEVMSGVVCLPHGWGHGVSGTRLDIANAHPGVNSDILNPPGLIDVPSNTKVVNGVPCSVRAVRDTDAVVAQS